MWHLCRNLYLISYKIMEFAKFSRAKINWPFNTRCSLRPELVVILKTYCQINTYRRSGFKFGV